MRFTLHGALQEDAMWKRISSFQRQSYIPIKLAVHNFKVIQITLDLRLRNINPNAKRKKKEVALISRHHHAKVLSLS